MLRRHFLIVAGAAFYSLRQLSEITLRVEGMV